ncbi:MAG: formimidoylglutamase [Bacteroidia bacterium]|nr:formimidoylglutamase [Bacteroidia bacterium]MDW8301971.1 formimidoylglutamase [Bacteroidia bacterium]
MISDILLPTDPSLFYSRGQKDDPKLGEFVLPYPEVDIEWDKNRVVIIGFPEERGVERNKGIIGTSKAPDIIRKHLYRLNANDARQRLGIKKGSLIDAGNVKLGSTLEESQHNLGKAVAHFLLEDYFVLVLGGGHETAFGHFLGHQQVQKPISVVNIDAHSDVRPLINGNLGHSGSPFRQMLEYPNSILKGQNLVEFGLQGHCNSVYAIEYLYEQGVNIVWYEDIANQDLSVSFFNALRQLDDKQNLYVSIDTDCITGVDFPATSASPAQGFSVQQFYQCCTLLAHLHQLKSMDIVEYNPNKDVNEQSAKVIALGIWKFLIQKIGINIAHFLPKGQNF